MDELHHDGTEREHNDLIVSTSSAPSRLDSAM